MKLIGGSNNKFKVGNNFNARNGSDIYLQNMSTTVGNNFNLNNSEFEARGGSFNAYEAGSVTVVNVVTIVIGFFQVSFINWKR